jgi:hypothetical protein
MLPERVESIEDTLAVASHSCLGQIVCEIEERRGRKDIVKVRSFPLSSSYSGFAVLVSSNEICMHSGSVDLLQS